MAACPDWNGSIAIAMTKKLQSILFSDDFIFSFSCVVSGGTCDSKKVASCRRSGTWGRTIDYGRATLTEAIIALRPTGICALTHTAGRRSMLRVPGI
jgi:hypothetical protein